MAGKRRRFDVSDEQIIEGYLRTHSAPQTAKALGIGQTTVERVLRKHQVPRPGLVEWRKRATKYQGKESEMRAAYESGATLMALVDRFGLPADSLYAVKQALKRAGAELRENVARREDPDEVESVRKMNASGMGQVPISLALGRSQSFVARLMKRHGIQPRRDLYRGENHPGWKGGRMIDSSGYVRVLMDKDDPLSSMRMHDGYVLEHRLVMARKFCRPLRRSETVHHIDGNRTNNHPDNLQLRQGKHGKHGKHAVMVCLDCGSHNIVHAPITN